MVAFKALSTTIFSKQLIFVFVLDFHHQDLLLQQTQPFGAMTTQPIRFHLVTNMDHLSDTVCCFIVNCVPGGFAMVLQYLDPSHHSAASDINAEQHYQ